MSSELILKENPSPNEIPKPKQILTEENLNLMQETYNKFNSVTYSNEELNIFKDNVLSLLKERDKIFINKLSEFKTSLEKTNFEFNSQNKISNTKFSKIIETQALMTSRLDQLADYENFVNKTNEKLVSHEVRLTNIRSDFSLATQKYDKIYLDNLELPGYIGRCAKYKNCQVFFLDVIKDLAKLNIYREKNIIDLKMYKDKLETIISSMNSILDNNNESQIKYINEMKEKILKDCKSMFESVSDSMKEIRVENSKYSVDLIKTSMDLSKKWDKLEKIKEELLEKFNYDVNKYQMLTDDTIKSFEEFKNEYGVIRRKFMELAEFIKDVRFRKNIGGNVKKKEVKQMVKKMLKKRKSFEGEKVQLLSDITSIENIDYKKYYNFDSNDELENNNENNNENHNEVNNNNRSKSLKQKNKKNININNKEKEKEKQKFNEKKNIKNKNNNSSPKELKQKKEMNQSVEEGLTNKFNINKINPKEKEKETNKNKSSRSVNMNINISPYLNKKNKNNNNQNAINIDEKNIKNNLVIDSKNLKLKEEETIEKNKPLANKNNKNKESNIIKLVKNTSTNNIELRNIVEEQKEKEKENTTILYSNRSNGSKTSEKENMNNANNVIISNAKINIDSKPTSIEDVSTISEVKNSVNKDNKFNSEKSVSFISDSNGNNINKFIINEINLEQNDKIIKELASELEQSTAKKDKFEQKFKNACNNIEPINLLSTKNDNNPKENIDKKEIKESKENNINSKAANNNNINQINTTKIIDHKSNSNNIIKENSSQKEILNKVNVNIDNNINNNTENNEDNIGVSLDNKDIKMKNQISIQETPHVNNNIIKANNNNNNNNDMNNSNINSNIIKNESISTLNPIKINNEIHLNEVISSSSVNKKLHAFDQKLLNLELYTKEKIIELISQINLLKQNNNNSNNIKLPEKNVIESNKPLLIQNITPSSNEKYKTFNNSFNNIQNQKLTQQNSFNIEKMYETNNENNRNLLNISNNSTQNALFNNLDKKRYSLRNVNAKQGFLNTKVQKKNSNTFNLNTNNNINKKLQSNSLTENNRNINNNIIANVNSNINNNNIISNINSNISNNINNNINSNINNNINSNININSSYNNINNSFNNNINNNCISFTRNNINNINNTMKQDSSTREIIEGTGTKIIHNLSNDINAKFLKDTEKKMDNNNILKVSNIDDLYNKKSNKSINYGPIRNSFGDPSFNGAEIKLVDLNKLVNHQLPKNRLIPIHINDYEYFDHLKSK